MFTGNGDKGTRMRIQFITVLLAGLLAALNGRGTELPQVDEIVYAVRGVVGDGHWYANFGYNIASTDRKMYPKGGRLEALELRSGKVRTILADPDGTIRDPVVHYDGQKILFSYRRAGDTNFHLYEIGTDGTGLRQLTIGPWDDLEPCYLPDGGIVFCSSRAMRWVNCWFTQVATIHRCNGDGSAVQMLSANIEQDNTPWVLPDGRIIYMRWEYVDRSRVNYHHLWTMNPDGTGQAIYFGNFHPGGVFLDGKPVPGTEDVVFIDSPGHGRKEHAGHLTVVSQKLGPDELSSKKRIAPCGDYRDCWAFSPSLFMVAVTNRLCLVGSNGEERVLLTLPDKNADIWLHEPRPLMKRPRETVLPMRTELKDDSGVFLLENVYEGRRMADVPKGTIKKLLILETLPKPVNFSGTMEPTSHFGTFTLPRVLGTVPVEEDGSAHFKAPALRALFFIALDAEGRAVKRMQSFTQVMPGEVLGCVGCHENRTIAPRPYASGSTLAARRKPSTIDAKAALFDVPDFVRNIQPILDRHCVSCHNSTDYKGRVNLSGDHNDFFSFGYYTLVIKGMVSDGRDAARSDYKPYQLGSGNDAFVQRGRGGHHDVKFSQAEIDMIRLWLDASAPYAGTYAALGTGMEFGFGKIMANRETAQIFSNRCERCHAQDNANKLNLFSPQKLEHTRHALCNLSRPELSLILRAPLAKAAGGLGLCPESEFKDASDPLYLRMLDGIRNSAGALDRAKRFDMPGFRPRAEYLREMKRFGALPPDFNEAKDPVDCYATDRAYWNLFIYRP